MSKNYTSISTEFREMLEVLIFDQKLNELIYVDNAGKVVIRGRFERLFMVEDEEFLKLDSGETIRVDKIFCVNGSLSTSYC